MFKLRILLFLIFSLTIWSCQKEGCTDPLAFNFDPEAKKSGSCTYTKVIFYAGSNRVGGNADIIEKIEVFQLIVANQELIGTINNPQDDNGSPIGCKPTEKSIVFNFTDGSGETRFATRYYYTNGLSEAGTTYILSPDKNTECLVENLTL